MVPRDDGPVNDRPARPNKGCPYSRKVQRKFAFLNKVRGVLEGLQDIVDAMDPDFDPTAYHTDPDESRLCVLGEVMAEAGHLLRDGESEEAEDRLLHGSMGAYQAALEAFEALVSEGLDFCEADGTESDAS
jgi:hypothetical protein